jgi:chemotaxis signal transduction protein
MLLVKVGHFQYLIPSDQIHYIDYIDTVTLLPFASHPVEGLTMFNNRPLLQVNLALALALNEQNGEKRIIFKTGAGEIALRADQVLNFTDTDAESTQTPPLFVLKDILPWLVQSPSAVESKADSLATDLKPSHTSLTVLLVTVDRKITALLSNAVFYIEEIEALQLLEHQALEADLLLKVKNTLLPGYSLARFSNHPRQPNLKQKAVIIRTAQKIWALVVDQVLGLETVETAYSIDNNDSNLWYITQAGEIREIIDPNQLTGMSTQLSKLANTQSQWTRPAVQMLNQVSTEGLRIYCGNHSYMLPLTLASKTLDLIDSSLIGKRRNSPDLSDFKNLKGLNNRIPWIDLGKLLLPNHHSNSVYGVLISLSEHVYAVLGVEKALLQLPLTTQQWLPLTNLPPVSASFFDAASYDLETGQWILRVVAKVEFAKLPWTVKKNIVKAISGWFDLTEVLSLNVVAQPPPPSFRRTKPRTNTLKAT